MAEKSFEQSLSDLDAGAGAEQGGSGPRGAAADTTAHPTVEALRSRFSDVIVHHTVMAGDEHVVYVRPDRVLDVMRWLREDGDQRYDLLLDVTAVDYGGGRPLEVVYQLWSTTQRRQLRVKAMLPLTALEVDSVCDIWASADWLERETYDMFGVFFRNHPDPRRILMPDNYAEGHPLRKDFPLRGRFTRAEQTRRALAMAVEDYYTPEELVVGGRVVTGAETKSAEASATATAGRPDSAEGWSQGTSGSAAQGAPGPEGAGA